MGVKILDLKQGTKEWQEERFKYCTASEVPVVLGKSPYQTKLQLFEQKYFKVIKNETSYIMEKGHEAEDDARVWLMKSRGLNLKPAVVVRTDCPLLASLDGYDENADIILESKLVGAEALKAISEGVIPEAHNLQVQTQLVTAKKKNLLYFARDTKGNSAIVEIVPDNEMQDMIEKTASEFMSAVTSGNFPEPTEKDFVEVQDERFFRLRDIKETISGLESQFEDLKKSLVSTYDFPRIRCGNITMVKSLRKGNVNYSKIPELQGLDLEKYRGKASSVVTVRVGK